ncbi:methylated-DNA--[protein]-cysteine S-methyltransferase [Listeria costaricensis]|uniref:methylated-DNA--[protein]-cysteine S-methyltransferase n=1 Tax=Listeria costaricensis TaxID=2026604 RepID=UPI000C06F2D0|nr:methylated-DNA--[protein]-cysteine S-methyltransferase [Listeria costaricensis]
MTAVFESPLGPLYLTIQDGALTNISYEPLDQLENLETEADFFTQQLVFTQLDEYFQGTRLQFDLPWQIMEGTAFQKRVWQVLADIPYGAVWSYQDVARKLGDVQAVRAVGQANRKNPLPIILPCHRVVGKNGQLVGYNGAEVDKKEWLLSHELQHFHF